MSAAQDETIAKQGGHTFFPKPPLEKCQRLRFSQEFCALPWSKKVSAYFGFSDVEMFERMPVPREDDDDAETAMAYGEDEDIKQAAAAPVEEYEDDLE